MTQKKLPIGIKSFDQIIDNNFVYADKTGYIYDLVTDEENSNFFLSRPRRFGKTLLIRTLKELFSGHRELFQGLLIDKLGYDFPKRAVISLSLSTDSDTKEIFRSNLMVMLKEIADAYNVSVPISSSAQYFGDLIKAVSKQTNSQVAVLIDEYDAPVTRNMANQSVATDNAKVLQDFFAKLKVDEVADSVAFTLVTGITRYALTSMDSGANHLNDISLESKYAGICGFTIPEFDALFADRMEDTLISLQQSGEMSPGASLRDLRAEIFDWYDGYNWGGETRVLNPFSILNFFDKKVFYAYWIQSGRPDHLTALIKTRPWDFIDLKLDSYLATTVRKSELTQLETAPVLFHSGYLTIDKTLKIPGLDYKSKKKFLRGYSFRLPNYEVSSSYYDECFKLLRLSTLELTAKKEELLSAFKAKDGQTVSSILSSYFGAVTFYQKPKSESSFHVFVQLILKAMDFTVDSELAGAAGRLDIGVRLSNHSYLIIELRYCPETNKLTENEINQILAATAKTKLPIDLYNESLASMIASKLGREKLDIALSKIGLPKPTVEDYNQFLANNAKEYLTPTEIDQTLAQTLKDELPKEDIEKILKKAQSTTKDSNEKIDALLAKTAQEALDDIQKRDYPSIVSFHANEITSLGLAIYGNGTKIVALFNPNLSEETLIT